MWAPGHLSRPDLPWLPCPDPTPKGLGSAPELPVVRPARGFQGPLYHLFPRPGTPRVSAVLPPRGGAKSRAGKPGSHARVLSHSRVFL